MQDLVLLCLEIENLLSDIAVLNNLKNTTSKDTNYHARSIDGSLDSIEKRLNELVSKLVVVFDKYSKIDYTNESTQKTVPGTYYLAKLLSITVLKAILTTCLKDSSSVEFNSIVHATLNNQVFKEYKYFLEILTKDDSK